MEMNQDMMPRSIIADELAIDGGTPVRSHPLAWEFPGGNGIGAEKLELVSRVVRAQSPFRFYGTDPSAHGRHGRG